MIINAHDWRNGHDIILLTSINPKCFVSHTRLSNEIMSRFRGVLVRTAALGRVGHRMLTIPASTTPPPPSVPQQVFDAGVGYWKRYVYVRMGAYGLISVAVAYTLYTESEAGVVSRMESKFTSSTVDKWAVRDEKAIIARTDLQAQLKALLRPDADFHTYAVVVGASGTGKSTAVRKAIRDLEGNKGVVYFMAPSVVAEFSLELSATLGYSHPLSIWNRFRAKLFGFQPQEPAAPSAAYEPLASWRVIRPLLLKTAEKYKAKHNRPPVLVLDAMDRVAKQDPQLFMRVQEFAKDCADEGNLLVVFVFSDGTALPLLNAQSAESRVLDPYEVGDVSDEDAVKYLTTQLKLPSDKAEALVKHVAGGRLALLNKVGQSPRTFEEIEQKMHTKTSAALLRVGLTATHPLFKKLLPRDGHVVGVKVDEAHRMIPEATAKELLRANILLQHTDETYTFHSRHVETFIRQKVDEEAARLEAERRAAEEAARLEAEKAKRWWPW